MKNFLKIMEKEKQLEELNTEEANRIFNKNKEWGEIWLGGIFLPTYYQHQYNIVFIGLQPSENLLKKPHLKFLGNFNISSCDKKFQNQLVEFGFGGSYVTDIVKLQRDSKARPNREDIEFFLSFLKRELEIIKPQIIVSLGVTETYDILKNYKKELNITKLAKVYHPAYVCQYNKFKEWDKQFKKIYEIVSNNSVIEKK